VLNEEDRRMMPWTCGSWFDDFMQDKGEISEKISRTNDSYNTVKTDKKITQPLWQSYE
jgi:hypothetical protein